MIDTTIDPSALRVDLMWDTSVERVLGDAPDLFGWAS